MSEAKWIACGLCGMSIFITSIVLFSLSFSVLELEEWGLRYDTTFQTVGNTARPSGRYFLGLGKQFIIYPRSMQSITFSYEATSQSGQFQAWSRDGLNVFIDATFFFTLNETKLHDFYFELGPQWYAYLVRCTYSAVKITTVDFPTEAYFSQRENISAAIKVNLLQRINNITEGAVILQSFQLKYIAFANALEQAIESKLIQSQSKKTAQQQNQTRYISKSTDQIFANAQNNISIINANVTQLGSIVRIQAQSNYFSQILSNYVTNYNKIFSVLNITTDKDKLMFIYATELPQINPSIQTFVGFKEPLVGKQ